MTVTAAEESRRMVELVREHELGARADLDPEHVHQLRVTVRRLRALVRGNKAVDRELRWFGRSLGAVRDLDVLLGRLTDRLAGFAPDDAAAAAPLLAVLRAERVEARALMLAVLNSDRYRALLDTVPTVTTTSLVDSSAAKAYRVVRDAVDALGDYPPDEALHALRVKGKRLRYAAELTDGLGPVAKAAKELQTLLGEHQDASVAEETVRRLVRTTDDPAAAFVAGRLVQAEQERKQWCRARLPHTLAAVREAAAGHPELAVP